MSVDIKSVIREATVAAPCPANWADMVGDDKVRLCAQCNLNVHNTRMMTDEEVLQLVLDAASGKRVCGKLYKRADGTLLTQNCPVGISRLRERIRQAAAWAAGALAFLVSAAVQAAPDQQQCAGSTKKTVMHGTVRAEGNGLVGVDIKPASTFRPKVAQYEISGSFDGELKAVPTPQLIAAAQKSLSNTEAKFGKDSLQAASEHERLGQLYATCDQPQPDAAEPHFERAYQIYIKSGNKKNAKSLAQSRFLMAPNAALKAHWKTRANVPE